MLIIQDRVLFNDIDNKYNLNINDYSYNNWRNKKKSSFIESIIINAPLNPLILYDQSYNKFIIFDGKERLIAIKQFINNDYYLEDLSYTSELNGLYYKDLPSDIISKLQHKRVPVNIIMLDTWDDFNKIYNKIKNEW